MKIKQNSLDDIMMSLFKKLLNSKNRITPSKGAAKEIIGVNLELRSPRSRLSRSEKRGILFSALGEFLWYMAGSDKISVIEYYIPIYPEFSDDGLTANGAYGPRLYSQRGYNQLDRICELIKDKPDTRQAVIQLLNTEDIYAGTKDVPCTCTLQFFPRGNTLHLMCHMRSNDAYKGLPHDIFAFTMLHEFVARETGLVLGTYHHSVGSMHLYEEDFDGARTFLSEGWQENLPMPPMPDGPQHLHLNTVLEHERTIRTANQIPKDLSHLPPYWADLTRLLAFYSLTSESRSPTVKERRQMASILHSLDSDTYTEYIQRRTRSRKGLEPEQLSLVPYTKG